VTVVLDASAGIEVVLNRSRSNEIASVLESSKRVYAPGLYKAEVTNVLWKYLRSGQITKEDAKAALQISLGLIDEYIDIQDFTDEVLSESVRLNHSAYDIFYLVLARRTDFTLITLDRKFRSLASGEGLDTIGLTKGA
jgi:predicted nucleic acid-binding protein